MELQFAIAHGVKIALLVLIAGVLIRGRARLCWVFPFYMAAALVGNSLSTFWPDRFLTPAFWVLKQGAYDSLKMLLAIELAWRAFGRFPGAMQTARLALLLLLSLSTLGLVALTPPSSYATLWNWQPGVATAALWLLTATALIVVWYQIPVHDWQRAIMLGLAPYLLVFVALMGTLERHGWKMERPVVLVEQLSYLALILFWVYASWRRDSADAAVRLERSAA